MGSFYKIINKDIKELNGIVISLFSVLFLVGVGFISYILTNNSYALFGDSLTGSKTIGVEASLPPVPAADAIIAKVGTDGLVEETHPATEQLEAVTDYRYTGANPNNYVSFNNELWRIIGVFPAEDASGNIENRIKIIRNESIGSYSWDNKASGTGSSTSSYGGNDWSDSALQIVLNEGAYYNRTTGNCPSWQNGATTACDFSTTGLTEEAKSMISDAKWYLGGTKSYTSALASHWYTYERGTTVYSGRPTNFIGEIGLLYPSDYGYATSGGSITSREVCLATALYSWSSSNYSDCKNNDWLYLGDYEWTITHRSGDSNGVFSVHSAGYVYYSRAFNTDEVRPSLYLFSDVMISGGVGTSSDPYILQLPDTFTFNIDDSIYTADTGSTWQEWINSSYNTEGFFDNDGDVYKDSTFWVGVGEVGSIKHVSIDDVINRSNIYSLNYGAPDPSIDVVY